MSKRNLGNERVGGEYVYWEPMPGTSVKMYLKGNVRWALVNGVPLGTKALEMMDTPDYSKALVESTDLCESFPANPYSLFIGQVAGPGPWASAGRAKPENLGRLGKIYRACWDLAQKILAKRIYSGRYRNQRLINLCDVFAIAEAACDNWKALRLQDIKEMKPIYRAGVTAEDWFKAWKCYLTACNCATVYTSKPISLAPDASIKSFVDRWKDADQHWEEPEGAEEAVAAEEAPQAEDKRNSVVLINDASATELMCGKKEHHSITMYSQMTYVLWFDVPQSLLSTCATVLGLDKLPYFDKVEIEDNRLIITADVQIGESYPCIDGIRDDRLKQLCAKVDSVYNDVVALSHSLAQAQGKYAESWTKAETC